MIRIKTDSTPYIHNRTKERYLARHVGLMKVGHAAPLEGWIECVMYQKAEKPSEWFCRDLATFAEQFTEERQLAINEACAALEIDPKIPHGRIENWFVVQDILFGDITEHDIPRKVGTDARTSKVKFIDRERRFAITENSIYELVGDEVTLA